VKGVLAHIYSDGGHCVKSGRAQNLDSSLKSRPTKASAVIVPRQTPAQKVAFSARNCLQYGSQTLALSMSSCAPVGAVMIASASAAHSIEAPGCGRGGSAGGRGGLGYGGGFGRVLMSWRPARWSVWRARPLPATRAISFARINLQARCQWLRSPRCLLMPVM
jgi:hypothetical protein